MFNYGNVVVADQRAEHLPETAEFGVEYRIIVAIPDTAEDLNTVIGLTLSLFGGASISHNHGVYTREDNGKIEIEHSVTISVFAGEEDRARAYTLASRLRAVFNQESVLLAEVPVFGVLVR